MRVLNVNQMALNTRVFFEQESARFAFDLLGYRIMLRCLTLQCPPAKRKCGCEQASVSRCELPAFDEKEEKHEPRTVRSS